MRGGTSLRVSTLAARKQTELRISRGALDAAIAVALYSIPVMHPENARSYRASEERLPFSQRIRAIRFQCSPNGLRDKTGEDKGQTCVQTCRCRLYFVDLQGISKEEVIEREEKQGRREESRSWSLALYFLRRIRGHFLGEITFPRTNSIPRSAFHLSRCRFFRSWK